MTSEKKHFGIKNNLSLIIVSCLSVAILIGDVYFHPSLFSLLKIIVLLIIFTGIILTIYQQSQSAIDIISIGFLTIFLVYLIDTIISYRSYQPSLLFYSSLKLLIFGYGIISCQKIYTLINPDSNNISKEIFLRFKFPKKVWQSIVTIIATILGFLMLVGSYPLVSCKITNGEYTTGGLIEAEFCLYEYTDGGNSCMSSKDCERDCVIYDSINISSSFTVTGVCQSNNDPYGCYGYVENGKSYGLICTD